VRRGPTDGLDLRPPGDVTEAEFDPRAFEQRILAARATERLLKALADDPQTTEAVVDGRAAGMSIDAAVQALRGAVTGLRRGGTELPPGLRMTIRTGDGSSVTWQAGTGVISVSV
jgi:hypothetical protein